MTTQNVTEPNRDAPPSHEGPLSPGGVRLLKIAIAVMSFMIVAGLTLVTMRVIYLASVPKRQDGGVANMSAAGPAASRAASATAAVAGIRLALPAGAIVRAHGLNGDRLTVQFDSPVGSGIVIVDTASGQVVSRIDIVPEVPR